MEKSLKVWSEFTSTKKQDLKFRITDVPIEKLDEVLEILMNNLVLDGPTWKAAGIAQSEEASSEFQNIMEKAIVTARFHTMVCSIDTGTDEIGQIIGLSMVTLVKKDDRNFKLVPKTPEFRKVINYFNVISSNYNVMENHNLNSYYAGRGVAVHRDFRGLGIAQEFLKARRMLCKEQGVHLTGAWMSSLGSQKAAQRDGWDTVLEINNKDYARNFDMEFDPKAPNPKYMIGRAL